MSQGNITLLIICGTFVLFCFTMAWAAGKR